MVPLFACAQAAEEVSAVECLALSRTAEARRVERARLVWAAHQGEMLPTSATALGVSTETVRRRIVSAAIRPRL